MTRFSCLSQSAVLALCLPGTAAFADLTSADVWADWKDYMTSAGYEIVAEEQSSGGILSVEDLTMSVGLGEDSSEGAIVITMGAMQFVEEGDGTVSIELPPEMSINVTMDPDVGETATFSLDIDQANPVMRAAGDPTDLTYTYSASTVGMVLAGLVVDGAPVPADAATFNLGMSDVAYTTKTAVGAVRTLQQDARIGSINYDVAFRDPENAGSLKLVGAVQGIALTGAGSVPIDGDPQNMNAMLAAGLDFDAGLPRRRAITS